MTDIHSHILFGIDDGAIDVEESIALLNKMKDIGFNNVILTPHYIDGSDYCCDNEEKNRRYSILKSELFNRGIDINIYLGNEIFINNNIYNLINDGYIYSLANSKYILIELPFHNEILSLEDIIYEIKLKGLIPIIAHPERYFYFQKNYKMVDKLREEGILFQSNFASILGYYGKECKKLIKYMLKKKYVDYLGTDLHSINECYVLENFDKIKKHIIKITKNDYFNDIMNNNVAIIERIEE